MPDRKIPYDETYSHGYDVATSSIMGQRRAVLDASFMLPFLKPGMNLLDCGCGPGSITLGLAEAVEPGMATGIDVSESEVDTARQSARQSGVENAEFKVGDVYDLQFEEASFDAVFVHTVLEHLSHPETAIREMARVLKPGGVMGARHGDWGGRIVTPENNDMNAFLDAYAERWRQNGGEPNFGRVQTELLLDEGFIKPIVTTSTMLLLGDSATTGLILLDEVGEDLINRGLATANDLEVWGSALERWGATPGAAYNVSVYWETVARKPA